MKYIFVLLILLNFESYSQVTKKEFEGYIEFEHKVIPHVENYNVNYDYGGIGKSSRYTYSKGKIKFENRESYFVKDIFLSSEKSNYFITQNPDTIMLLDATKLDAELIEFEIEPNVDTILNMSCSRITIKLKPIGKAGPVSYRRYYFSNEYYVNPEYFTDCKGSFYDIIYKEIKSIPLRIEYEWPNRTVVWQAIEVKNTKIDDAEFSYDKSKTIIKIN